MIQFIMTYPPVIFKAKINKEDFAPGIFAGTEGCKITIKAVNLQTGELTLEIFGEEILQK